MSLIARRTLFYFFVAGFIIIGTLVIFYSQGWRIDFDNFGIKKTGGIFVRTIPRETTIYIDGKDTEQKNGFLLSGRLMKNLVPRQYEVRIEKEGWKKWQNRLPVIEEVVTEVKNVILIPETGVESIFSASTTLDFWENGDELVIKDKENGLVYKDYELSGSKYIASTSASDKIITYNERQDTYLLNDVRNKSTININLLFNNQRQRNLGVSDRSGIVSVEAYPNEENELVIITTKAVYKLNFETRAVSRLSEEGMNGIAWWHGDLVTAQNNWVYKINSERELEPVFNVDGLIKEIKTLANGEIVVLSREGALVISENSKGKEIAHSVSEFHILDEDRIMFMTKENQVNVYYQAKQIYQRFELPRVVDIKEVAGAGENHIIVAYPEGIYLLELINPNVIMEKPSLYFEMMIEDKIDKLIFNEVKEIIYYLNNKGELREIDFLHEKI